MVFADFADKNAGLWNDAIKCSEHLLITETNSNVITDHFRCIGIE